MRPVMTIKEAMQGVSAKKRAVQSVICGVLIGFMCGFVGAGGGMMMLLILAKLDTSNIVFSTISIITSFFATSLTMLRSFYYAIGYAANDLVLIVLWVLASIENPGYIPVVVNFVIFFLNDMYGFVSWKKRELQQA